MKCPSCGHTWTKPTGARAPVDPATLTDAALYAHYKRTAPVEDVRFFLTHADLDPALRDAVAALLDEAPHMARTDVYRRLVVLQARWRIASNAREQAAHAEAA